MAKEQYNPNSPFNQEQIDSLRLETENISPKEKEEAFQIAQKLNGYILEIYSDYIEYSKEPEEFPKRLVFTKSADTISRFKSIWLDSKKEEKDLSGITIHPDEFGILWFKNKESFPEIKKYIEKNKKEFLERYGSLEKAEEEFIEAYMHNIIIHELLHLYSPALELPSVFKEAGAYFYAHHLLIVMGDMFFSLNKSYDIKLRNLYQKLIDKYGDDVNKLFFGQEVDEEIRNSIFKEVKKRKFKKLL